MKTSIKVTATLLLSFVLSSIAQAGPVTGELAFWGTDGWTQFAADDGVVGPGGGGQSFDAEFLYYKLDGTTLSIGLQTGYDVVDGVQTYSTSPRLYYSGDLALSFDGSVVLGDGTTYEQAVDFGLYTEDYYLDKVGGGGTGVDAAGLYDVGSWNNDVYVGHTASNPFAMETGTLVNGLLNNTAGYDAGFNTYWRIVSFDVTGLGTEVDAHWTMSCGNDAINGSFSIAVPEASTLAMFLSGLLLIGAASVRRRRLTTNELV